MRRLTVQPSNRFAVWLVVIALHATTPLRAQITDSAGLPPAGFGTLRQDEVAIRLTTPNLQIRVLPVDERIIRLMAPDTYNSMHQLRQMKGPEIDRAAIQQGARHATLFLVTFFASQPGARFAPEEITVTSQNRFYRPLAIVPLSPQWGSLELNQRETVNAIYLYEEGIPILEPLTVAYGGVESAQWEQILRVLDRERARVYSRAGTVPGRRKP